MGPKGRALEHACHLTLVYALILGHIQGSRCQAPPVNSSSARSWNIEAVMPDHPAPPETYLCMRVDLPDASNLKLTGIEPLSHEELVHHMLLFGCSTKTDKEGVWSCQGHGVCPSGGTQQILYGWAKGADAMQLPHGVGYKVGSGTKIDNLVLQIHYAVERPAHDTSSGIKLQLSDDHIPFSAGMMMFASTFEIPPRKQSHLVPNQCCYSGFEPAHGFAFRVHTHMLGRSVYMDELLNDGTRRRVVEHSPQLPQGFTPITGTTFWPGQRVESTCDYDSRERTEITYAGATHHNEMCNLYMIMWSELPVFVSCYDGFTSVDLRGAGGLSAKSVLLREDPKFWDPLRASSGAYAGGQISGVAKGHNGTVWVFQRGDRVWGAGSFSGANGETVTHTDPIPQKTIFQLDQDTGDVLGSWGEKTFFMPHMVTLDRWGHVWVTDVGLHQVFKYDVSGTLLQTLGTRLKPGAGDSFCKPTQVAVGKDGRVYVSDGYCASRVAQFSAEGVHQGDFVLEEGAMNVPHSLALEECKDRLMVADRENSRVHQFELSSRKFAGTWDLSQEGLVFGLAVGPYGALFALTWDRDRKLGHGRSTLLLLHENPRAGVDERWVLEGVESPHDLALVAAPLRLAGQERPLAVLVSETRTSGSRLHKFILMPEGTTSLAHPAGAERLPPASEQWKAVFAAAEGSQQEIPPEVVAAKTADLRHTQAVMDDSLPSIHPATSWGHHASHTSAGVGGAGAATWGSNHRLTALVIISLLVCAASVAAYRRFAAGRLAHGVRLYR